MILTRSEEIHRIDSRDLHWRETCVRKVSLEVAQTLKLALIGTHGVGKTTLAYEICSLLKKADHNVELVTEVARRSPVPHQRGRPRSKDSSGSCTRRSPRNSKPLRGRSI